MKPQFGLTYSMIDGHSTITSITPRNGDTINIEYKNGVPDIEKLTEEQLNIITDCSNWLEEQWNTNPKSIVRGIRKGKSKRANGNPSLFIRSTNS